MAVDGHLVLADDFNLIRTVAIQIEVLTVRRVPSPRHHMLRVAPDEMRRLAVRIEDEKVFAIRIAREHARGETLAFFVAAPTMQKEEARAVGVEEEMVEPMLRAFREAIGIGN